MHTGLCAVAAVAAPAALGREFLIDHHDELKILSKPLPVNGSASKRPDPAQEAT